VLNGVIAQMLAMMRVAVLEGEVEHVDVVKTKSSLDEVKREQLVPPAQRLQVVDTMHVQMAVRDVLKQQLSTSCG
jgi:hypothetical protein